MALVQREKESSEAAAQAKINELADTLRLAKEEIRRLDGEVQHMRGFGPVRLP